jgi:hypothetical protein
LFDSGDFPFVNIAFIFLIKAKKNKVSCLSKKLQKASITALKPKVTNSLFPMFSKKDKRLLFKLKKKSVATKVPP